MTEPLLQADCVSLHYGSGTSILHAVEDVSLAVAPASFVGVIGPSGSGKSSLMYLLSALKRPSSGRVSFEGTDYAARSATGLAEFRRERFGFVFQQHFLINYLSTLENVLVGARKQDRQTERQAYLLLDRVGLLDKARQRPYQLSIGQRQRVAVVRALIHQPTLVFADEPTAALDQTTGHQVVDLLSAYRQEQGASVVVVTHDPAMLTGADRVLHMRDGQLF